MRSLSKVLYISIARAVKGSLHQRSYYKIPTSPDEKSGNVQKDYTMPHAKNPRPL